MKQPSKPYKISEIVHDVDSPSIKVITTKGEQYEYPIEPASKSEDSKVELIYKKGEWIIRSIYYDKIIDKEYDDCIILKHAHKPTHHDIREISPLYSGFYLISKRKISSTIDKKN